MHPVDSFEENQELPDRLSDPKLVLLGELLDQMEVDSAMDLEELDGFFAALHCGPELVPPSEYIPEVVGDDHEFLDADAAQLFVDLLKHHWNEVGAELHRDVVFDPILLRDENGAVYGNNWAIGFLRGVDMRKEAWSEIVDDELTIFLTPMLRLAYEIDPDALIPDFAGKPLTDEQRDDVLLDLCEAVGAMFDYLEPHRRSLPSPPAASERSAKIGRNDPCYCGSGKKYKKCCGSTTVN